MVKKAKEENKMVEQPKMEDEKAPIPLEQQENYLFPHFTKFDDKGQKGLLEDACGYVDNEIASLRDKINKYENDIQKLQSGN